MKRLVIILVTLFSLNACDACDGENARDCSMACQGGGHPMASWSRDGGCICETGKR